MLYNVVQMDQYKKARKKHTQKGDRRNVPRPLARIHSTNQHTETHLLTKFGYK